MGIYRPYKDQETIKPLVLQILKLKNINMCSWTNFSAATG